MPTHIDARSCRENYRFSVVARKSCQAKGRPGLARVGQTLSPYRPKFAQLYADGRGTLAQGKNAWRWPLGDASVTLGGAIVGLSTHSRLFASGFFPDATPETRKTEAVSRRPVEPPGGYPLPVTLSVSFGDHVAKDVVGLRPHSQI